QPEAHKRERFIADEPRLNRRRDYAEQPREQDALRMKAAVHLGLRQLLVDVGDLPQSVRYAHDTSGFELSVLCRAKNSLSTGNRWDNGATPRQPARYNRQRRPPPVPLRVGGESCEPIDV